MPYIYIYFQLRDPSGLVTYSKFVKSPLMIDLWMEDCQIFIIFPYFSWKCRRGPAQDYALNTKKKNYVGGCSLHECLKKYKQSWDIIWFYDQLWCCLGDFGHGGSKVWCYPNDPQILKSQKKWVILKQLFFHDNKVIFVRCTE